MSEESGDLGDAARRGMQRAGVHLMRAAIEVIEGVSAFLEEMQRADGASDGDGDGARGGGIERIELDGEE